jgi:galactofuranosylgalactofuranosylrhamnosyl-N-acetylglucosaminyl-diphospho-decaprenol beta-1,5/1,6-galactofuranosyltransferase
MTSSVPSLHTVHRVVLPVTHTDESLPLYVAPVAGGSAITGLTVTGRRGLRLGMGGSASFGSYFNAFPAAYWQKWTRVRAVRLELETVGDGVLTVYRSGADGKATVAQASPLSGTVSTVIELPVTGFDDGGWYWFDLEASMGLELREAHWSTVTPEERSGKLSIGITTFDKPDYCVATLQALADARELLAEIDRVFLVDQGTRKVADEPAYPALAERLGDRLRVIEQPNLGGSGGFSRSMAETLTRDESDFVLLLDDDVEIETEGILRALAFARSCTEPTIVGGHMLDLNDRSVLHAYSEIIDPVPFMWGPPDREHERHDFRRAPLVPTPWLHRREDSDFNGWWMCLIPTHVIREIGLSLPVFIKWDDAEYGLRAAAAGYRTVSFPGAALWHVSWVDKDDTLDWGAYFHARNRLVVALLHSDQPGGGRLLSEYRRQDLKHLLSMQYYPVTLRHQALRDVLSGPGSLHEGMHGTLAALRAQAGSFPEMRRYSPADAPGSKEGKRSYPPTDGKGPRGLALLVFTAKAAARHWFVKPARENVVRPQVELSRRDATWWRVPRLDSVLIDAADGSAAWYTRDRRQFRALWWQSIRLHRRIAKQWNALQAEYRSQAPHVTSVAAWSETFREPRD